MAKIYERICTRKQIEERLYLFMMMFCATMVSFRIITDECFFSLNQFFVTLIAAVISAVITTELDTVFATVIAKVFNPKLATVLTTELAAVISTVLPTVITTVLATVIIKVPATVTTTVLATVITTVLATVITTVLATVISTVLATVITTVPATVITTVLATVITTALVSLITPVPAKVITTVLATVVTTVLAKEIRTIDKPIWIALGGKRSTASSAATGDETFKTSRFPPTTFIRRSAKEADISVRRASNRVQAKNDLLETRKNFKDFPYNTNLEVLPDISDLQLWEKVMANLEDIAKVRGSSAASNIRYKSKQD